MKICYIVGAGENYGLDFVPEAGDLLIAADGGLAPVQEAGLEPDLVIGDFDSLGYVPGGRAVTVLPTEKDVTDTWAAIRLGVERGYRRFCLYGCTGGRVDHTIANLQTVAHLSREGLEVRMMDRTQVISAVTSGALEFGPEKTGYVSVFAFDACRGVTLEGLKYELQNAALRPDVPLGVSNEFLGVPSRISVEAGTLLVVWNRNGKS